jgi:hypothetical protein
MISTKAARSWRCSGAALLLAAVWLAAPSAWAQPATQPQAEPPPLPAAPEPTPQERGFLEGRLFQIALQHAPDFSAAGAAQIGRLLAGETQTVTQTLQAGHCYVWIAAGDTGEGDLDLAVSVGGERVAGDNALDDWPVASFCTAVDTSAQVDLMMYSGSGAYGFTTYSRFFGGADLVEVRMNFHASTTVPGGVPQGPITRGTLAAGGEQSFVVPLTGGRCYGIVATAGQGVVDIDAFLRDVEGRLVSSDEATDNFPIVHVCPEDNQNYTLVIRMYEGSGDFGWQAFAF